MPHDLQGRADSSDGRWVSIIKPLLLVVKKPVVLLNVYLISTMDWSHISTKRTLFTLHPVGSSFDLRHCIGNQKTAHPESSFSMASGLTTGRASCLFIKISGPLLAALWFIMIYYVHQCQLWETSVFGDVDISVFVDFAVCWQTTMRLKFSFFLNRKLPNLSQQLQMLKCYSIYFGGISPELFLFASPKSIVNTLVTCL